jgi:tripartite-type tricarboxylate transporter receptor subunit TctC
MIFTVRWIGAILGSMIILLPPMVASSASPSVEAFYAANRLTIVNGYTAGSVYDLYARILAKHISKHIPGKPAVIVQNMPGAGSMKAANFIYGLASRDGSQIATFARGIPMQPLLDEQGVQYDATKMNWLGSLSTEVSVVFSWHTKPFKTVDDLLAREMVVAATGAGADSAIFPYVLNGVLGTRFKVVAGYPGATETLLAIERGEADGSAGTSWGNFASTKQDWIRDRKVNIILQLATRKQPDLGEIPLVMDLARRDADRKVLELIFSRQLMAYPYAAPPDVPAERLQSLREAFEATMKDAEFLADARQQKLDIDPVGSEELTAVLRRVYGTPADVIGRARSAIAEGMKKTVNK